MTTTANNSDKPLVVIAIGGNSLITDAEHFLAIQLDLFKGAFPDDRQVQMEVDWVEVHSYTC